MFKKRTNFRKKADAEDGGDDAGEAAGTLFGGDGEVGGVPHTKKKSSSSRSKGGGSGEAPSLLSFDDDEAEAQVFQVKRKSTKKKSMRAPDASSMRREGGGVAVETKPSKGGEYSLESLRELANSQKGFGARPAEHVDPNAPLELKLRGTLKPRGAEASALHARDPALEVRKRVVGRLTDTHF